MNRRFVTLPTFKKCSLPHFLVSHTMFIRLIDHVFIIDYSHTSQKLSLGCIIMQQVTRSTEPIPEELQ